MDDSSSWNYPNFKPNFLFNYNFQPFPNSPMDPKHPSHSEMMMTMGGAHHQFERSGECDVICGGDPKKKRLTSEQLESLESSFQEDIKLDPDRKMKLSRDLGLQPRQVAVWFQNRRARWKAKQLERLYDSLKCEFDIVSREKHALQDEVMKLRAMLMEQATRIQTLNHNHKQVSIGCTDQISGGDDTTVESTPATRAQPSGRVSPVGSIGAECHYMFNGDDYNTTVVSPPPPPYWPPLPSSYHPC